MTILWISKRGIRYIIYKAPLIMSPTIFRAPLMPVLFMAHNLRNNRFLRNTRGLKKIWKKVNQQINKKNLIWSFLPP